MASNTSFKPFIPANKKVRELTFRSVFIGLLFGFIFAVGNAYLALKIGTTISASIPAAILSMGILRLFRNSTILENNIVQTIATIGEGLAAGVVFTIPALFLLGEQVSIGRIFILSALGGVLGILFMIPMRRFIIVEEHGTLPFPEGTACAEMLKAGASGHSSGIMALWGFLVGLFYKIASSVLFLWNETVSWTIRPFQKTAFSVDATPALMGVGFIIGPRITSLLFAGGVLGWWVIIPLIKMFGEGATIFPSTIPVGQMSAEQIWSNYVRYIGAGTVAIGGLLSLVKIGPLLFKTVRVGFKELFGGFKLREGIERTDKDISMAWLILGSIAIILTLWLFPGMPMNFLTIVLLVVLGFFFSAVTSITVGLVGSTSNPVSGMTITTLLVTCVIFVLLGWTERIYLIAAITMSCVANCAVCLASATSQDLKAGFLLGSTPRSQQIAEILGVVIPSLALGGTLFLLNSAYKIGSEVMPAPQATLISMIAKGVIAGDLPYTLVIIGVIIGLILEIFKIPILPFAIGLYLPLSLSTGTMAGGVVSYFVNKRSKSDEVKEKGTLISSGMIGADACIGIVIALLTITKVIPASKTALAPNSISLIAFIALALFLGYFSLKRKKTSP